MGGIFSIRNHILYFPQKLMKIAPDNVSGKTSADDLLIYLFLFLFYFLFQ